MKIVCDIDGVICSNTWGKYKDAGPYWERIQIINDLHDKGHKIVFYTARGYETGIDWRELTEFQLKQWGVKYHELHFGKPSGDLYIDDKAINSETTDLRRLLK
jgi:hypothetical protein